MCCAYRRFVVVVVIVVASHVDAGPPVTKCSLRALRICVTVIAVRNAKLLHNFTI